MCFPSPSQGTFLLACSFTLRDQSQTMASASQIYLALSSTTSKDTVKARWILLLTFAQSQMDQTENVGQQSRNRSSRSGGCWTKFQHTKPSQNVGVAEALAGLSHLCKVKQRMQVSIQTRSRAIGAGPAGPVAAGLNFSTPNLHTNTKCGCGSTLLQCMIFREQTIASYCWLLFAFVGKWSCLRDCVCCSQG